MKGKEYVCSFRKLPGERANCLPGIPPTNIDARLASPLRVWPSCCYPQPCVMSHRGRVCAVDFRALRRCARNSLDFPQDNLQGDHQVQMVRIHRPLGIIPFNHCLPSKSNEGQLTHGKICCARERSHDLQSGIGFAAKQPCSTALTLLPAPNLRTKF